MSSFSDLLQNQQHFRLIRRELRLWLVPTVVIGLLGTLFALVSSPTYVATLGLMVRDEVAGELSSYGGRFSTSDERKAAQETILQIAQSREVVVQAIRDVTPQEDQQSAEFPQESLIRDWRDAIAVTAAKGSELGESELIYLQVEGPSPAAAEKNARAVAKQLRNYLNVLRDKRSASVIRELTGKLRLAKQSRDEATARLEQMEREIGSDLGELRTLNQSGSGESNLRTSYSQIKADLRQARSAHTRQREQLQFLQAAVDDPESIVATPNGVLESHPALKRLKDGLVDAQLRLAELLGKMNATHPRVKAAKVAIAETHEKLRTELSTALRAAKADLRVSQALIEAHQRQLERVKGRLDRLASMRARYENLVADVQDRTTQVKDAQRALATAVASQGAAQTTSLISFLGDPEASDRPAGPGRLVVIAAAWLGGLCVGLGILFLVAPVDTQSGRSIRFGRRATDRIASAGVPFGRRASDHAESGQPPKRRATDRIVDPRDKSTFTERQAADSQTAATTSSTDPAAPDDAQQPLNDKPNPASQPEPSGESPSSQIPSSPVPIDTWDSDNPLTNS